MPRVDVASDEPDVFTMIVLGDSVSRNFVRDTAGPVARFHRHEVATLAYPEQLRQSLSALLAKQVDLVDCTAKQQTIKGSLAKVSLLDLSNVNLVVVAHGGQEAILFPPPWLRWIQCFPDASDQIARSKFRTAADLIRRPVWRYIGRHLMRDPEGATVWLRRIGFENRIDALIYARTLRTLVTTVLEQSSALVVLLETCRAVTSYWLPSPSEMDANDKSAHELAHEFPSRVTVCTRSSALAQRSAFLADGAHLSAIGHAQVAAALTDCLRATLPVMP